MAFAFSAMAAVAFGEFVPYSSDDGRQHQSSVAVAGDGSFIVVWGHHVEGGAQPLQSIRGQRYHADGRRKGEELRVDLVPGDWGRLPAAAPRPGGGFVVVWEGGALHGPGRTRLWMRLFDADGKELPGEIRVNQRQLSPDLDGLPEHLSGRPVVVAAGDGGFLVAWQDQGVGVCNRADVIVRRFGPDGTPLGDESRVAADAAGAQVQPAVARAPGIGFAVVWVDVRHAGAKDEESTIRGWYLDDAGQPIGPEVVLGGGPGRAVRRPSVAVLSGGEVVVAWVDQGSPGDGSIDLLALRPEVHSDAVLLGCRVALARFARESHDRRPSPVDALRLRVLGSRGEALSPEFSVGLGSTVEAAAVRASVDGGFTVLWSGFDLGDVAGTVVKALRCDRVGTPIGDPVTISPRTVSSAHLSGAATMSDEALVAVWDGDEPSEVAGTRRSTARLEAELVTESSRPTVADRVAALVTVLGSGRDRGDRRRAASELRPFLQEAAAAVPALRRCLAKDPDEDVRAAAVATLAWAAEEPSQVAPVLFDALFDRNAAVRSGASEGLRWLEHRSPGFLLAALGDHRDPRVRAASPMRYDPANPEPPQELTSMVTWAQEARHWADRFEEELGGCSVARINARLDLLMHLRPHYRVGSMSVVTPAFREGLLLSNARAAATSDDEADRLARELSRGDVTRHEVLFILTELAALGRGSRRAVLAVWPLLGNRDNTIRSLALQAIWAMGGGTEQLDEFVRVHLTYPSSPPRRVALEALEARGVAEVDRFAGEVRSCVGDPASNVRQLAGVLVQWMDDDRCPQPPRDLVRVIPPLPPPPPQPQPTPAAGSELPQSGLPRMHFVRPGSGPPTRQGVVPPGGG